MRYSHTQSSSHHPSTALELSPTSFVEIEKESDDVQPPSVFDKFEPQSSPPFPLSHELAQQQEELGKDEVRQYMQTHSVKGAKMAKSRQPFVGEIVTVDSPTDPEVEFGIRRVGNREYILHRNLSSKIRYIPTDGDDGFVSEKDYPVGDMNVSTVLLGLASWNIEDPDGKRVEINRDNLLAYTTPEELDFIYDQVLEVNPVLSGKDKAKNS